MTTWAHNFNQGALANRATRFINQEELAQYKSVFAEGKASTRSDRYVHIPTSALVERLAKEGWLPTKVSEQRVRNELRQGFQKHMIRFRRFDGTQPTLRVGDSFVELVLVNSHDGSSAYQLDAGLFRLVCSNGLVVADSMFESLKFKHQGFDPREVIEASYRVIDDVPRIQEDVAEMQAVVLSKDEQLAFADAAIDLRFENRESAPQPSALLTPRRRDDVKDDLWTTYNRIQENVIERGGLRQPPIIHKELLPSGRTIDHIRRRTTRPVKGIDDNVKLNKALWTLAESMKKLKAA